MSRSYKHQPFMAICGVSAKQDKRFANRGVRRAHRLALHKATKSEAYEDFVLPHRLECACNEVYGWGRDGHQIYQALDDRDWQRYLEADSESDFFGSWPPKWFVQMMRK